MAESTVSSPNRRAFEAIMNCSAQLYSTRSLVKVIASIERRPKGGARKGRRHH